MRLRFLTSTALVALAAAGFSTAASAMDGVYMQVFGGAALTSDMEWDDTTTYSIENGSAFGGSIGMATGMDGVTVELDFLHTNRLSEGDPLYPVSTNTLMVNGKYTVGLSDMFDIYFGAGIGGFNLHYDSNGTIYDGWALGYQVLAGVEAKVSDQFSIIGEIRHQDAFSPVPVTGGYTLDSSINAVLVGLKVHM